VGLVLRRRREVATPIDAGETALRLAVLLGAGVAPERAWAFAADGEPRLAGAVRAADRAEALRVRGGEWPSPRAPRGSWRGCPSSASRSGRSSAST
jgi:hypothetical protein